MQNYAFVRLLALGLIGLAWIQAPPASASEEDDWYEVRTEHFVVRTNAERERALDEALSMIDEMIKWSSSTGQELEFKEIRKELGDSY